MSEIIPGLFLGSEEDYLNKEFMESKNIKAVVRVMIGFCPVKDHLYDSVVQIFHVPIADNANVEIGHYFYSVNNFIDYYRKMNCNILVHCLAGISRSATLTIAHIMCKQRISFLDGLKFVKSKRPIIDPNIGFLGALIRYEEKLNSKNN